MSVYEIQLDDEKFPVKEKDVATIPAGVFHRVFNTSETDDLHFDCVFEKYGDR